MLGHRWVTGKVKIGEQNHVLAKELKFLLLRFFHLHHEVGCPGSGRIHKRCAGSREVLVPKAGMCTCSPLHTNLQALLCELTGGVRCQRNPRFVPLDLTGNANTGD